MRILASEEEHQRVLKGLASDILVRQRSFVLHLVVYMFGYREIPGPKRLPSGEGGEGAS